MKTDFEKVLGRTPNGTGTYYNRTGKRDKTGKPIFERLTFKNFTSQYHFVIND